MSGLIWIILFVFDKIGYELEYDILFVKLYILSNVGSKDMSDKNMKVLLIFF